MSSPGNAVLAKGTLKNFNTIEEFKDSNKTALFNQELDKVRTFPSYRQYQDVDYYLCVV